MGVSLWPILLKKSTMVSTVEKYALEIEIFTLSRGIQAQISRSGAQKRRFQRSVCGQSGRTDFFNRIGRSLSVVTTAPAGQVECKRLLSTDAIDWSVAKQMGGQRDANFHYLQSPIFSRIKSGFDHARERGRLMMPTTAEAA